MNQELERRICERIIERQDELVELARALIGFDTTTHVPGAPAREEAALQDFLAAQLRTAGATVQVTEPDPAVYAGHRMIPEGFDFTGRPQLVARFAGTGGGRSLLFCGHVDVVDVEPRDAWPYPPLAAEVSDGRIHGRGACDMKGGVACMVLAAVVLAECGASLAGDLLINTVTEEESTGAGGLVSARTLTADAAVVPEPTGLQVWIACRGSLLATITVKGRTGHAGLPPRDPADGGAVNAIEKTAIVLDAIQRLREHWSRGPRHPYLSAPDCVPTIIQGGDWIVSYPGACRLECHIEFLPEQAGDDGWGAQVRRDFEEWIARAAADDPWLAAHPPGVQWGAGAVPPAQVRAEHPIVQTALAATRAAGRRDQIGGMDNWHDGATLTVEAGIPAICLGPGDLYLAHTTFESVPIADLVDCAQALAITALRFCGPPA